MRSSASDQRGQARRALKVFVVLAIVGLPSDRASRADDLTIAPMPPVPEDMRTETAIQPASLEIATPLPLDSTAPERAAAPNTRTTPKNPMGNWSVLAALGSAFIVLAVFRFWQTRRTSRELPGDVFEVLGEATLGGPHAVRVVRFGPRTLLVSLSAAGCQTLATLDDPQATERIVNACAGSRLPRPSRPSVRKPHVSPGREEP